MNLDNLTPFRYENLLLPQLREILAKFPMVIIPIGILEWHGNHNALGMDGLVAQHLCDRVMGEIKQGVLMPLHWVGTFGYVHYEGTICYEEQTTTQFLTQLLSQVVKVGFKLIVLISGHGGSWQQRAIQTAVKSTLELFGKSQKELAIIGVVYPELAPNIRIGHAGPEETSLLMRIGQIKGTQLVDLQNHQNQTEILPLYSMPDESAITIHENPEWRWNEILPDSSKCSPEHGEKLLKSITEGIIEEIYAYCEEMSFEVKHE